MLCFLLEKKEGEDFFFQVYLSVKIYNNIDVNLIYWKGQHILKITFQTLSDTACISYYCKTLVPSDW